MFEDTERRCPRFDVSVQKIQKIRFRPAGHLHRKGNEQKDTADERRIEDVFAQTAKSHLGNDDSDETTDERHPDRHV